MGNKFQYKFLFLLAFSGILIIAACEKDNSQGQIPYANINLVIKPNSTMYIGLNAVGGWMYIDAPSPSRGLIVYRKSLDEFLAFERTCPYDPQEVCATLHVDDGFTLAVDSCCQSKFLILTGNPFSGPANMPMLQYRTNYDGVNLYIFN